MTEPEKRLKIFIHPIEGVGHQNACIGIAQALRKRGHDIYFLLTRMFAGSFEKHGFKEFILNSRVKEEMMKKSQKSQNQGEKTDHPLEAMSEELEKIRDEIRKDPLAKLESMSLNNKDSFWKELYEEMVELDPQIQEIIEKEKPDLILVDNIIIQPCILKGSVPWVLIESASPQLYLDSPDMPPMFSGFPSNDRSKWDEYREVLEKTYKTASRYYQNKVLEEFGYPPMLTGEKYLCDSPFMHIYGYPEELDYPEVTTPEKFMRVEAFCRDTEEKFELPEEFKAKIKPGDKLIYISLGSFGSIDVDLMKKIVGALANTPHKYIVSMGANDKEYQLPDNMWGKAFLPQIKILPLVDMVITHGGNNTVTESMYFGKPMLVLPLFVDQFDNAQRVTEKGFGYRLDTYGFKDEEMVETVNKILSDNEMIKRAEQAGKRIRSSDSKERVCEKIEQMIDKWKERLQNHSK